jgi:Ca2+-binding RTX toxin-like protein
VLGGVQKQDESQMPTINGTAAPDSLDGGAGNDQINGLAGNDTLHGLGGNDTLIGGDGLDVLYGGDGNDLINVSRGDDARGENDNDVLKFVSSDNGGLATYMNGNAGTDTAILDFSAAVDAISSYTNNNGSGQVAGVNYYEMERLQITGGSASDLLVGGIGDDTISGGAGNDRLVGGLGLNKLTGGAGRDFGSIDVSDAATNRIVTFVSGAVLNLAGSRLTQIEGLGLTTGGGKDKINVAGETLGSVIDTGGGNDSITHGDWADSLTGGSGADTISAGRGDTVNGGSDADTLSGIFDSNGGATSYFDGGSEVDRLTLDFSASPDGLSSYSNNNGSGAVAGVNYYNIERLMIIGSSASDLLVGNIGDDTLQGGGGNDRLVGGIGANKIVGGAGRDIGTIDVSGTTGNRIITFDPGATLNLLGNSLSQIEGLGLKAGTGRDTINVSLATIGSEIDGGAGNDQITGSAAASDSLSGGGDNDIIHGLRGDTVNGNDGNDTIDFVFEENGGATTYSDGGDGLDKLTLDFSGSTDAVSSYTNNNGSGAMGGLNYYNTESLIILGGTASDLLVGGIGDDTITGGTGNDRLVGGIGANKLVGGAGNDIGVIDYSSVGTAQNINFKPAQTLVIGGNSLSQVEGIGVKLGVGNDTVDVSKEIIGSEIDTGGGNDDITGGVGADSITAGAGNDDIFGGESDTISGYEGNDAIVLTFAGPVGTTYADGNGDVDRLTVDFSASTTSISSYSNNNGSGAIGGVNYYNQEILTFKGGSANDTIVGNLGNDTLTGGLGADRLDGTGGNDVYLYLSSAESTVGLSARDTIVTFAGGDSIDLSAIDAKTDQNGNQAFTFRGTAAFTGAGQIRYEAAGADTLILISTDADHDAEMAILVSGAHVFAATDFVL